MKSVFLLLFFALLTLPNFGQVSNKFKLIPFETNNKWGYINEKGKIVIQPKFDEANRFHEGLAAVAINEKYGFIDETGKFIIEPQYADAYEFSEGLAPVVKDKEAWGFSEDSVSDALKKETKWKYIDRKGNMVIEAKFALASSFSEGLADVLVGTPPNVQAGFIDKTGNLVIEPEFGYVESFSSGLAIIANWQPETTLHPLYNKKAFIDKTGNSITPFYELADSFSEGLAGVKINNLWGFINNSGSLIIPIQFDYVDKFSEGFAVFGCGKEKFGYINKKGNKLTDCIFKAGKEFKEGLAPIQNEDEKWGFISTRGELIIKPQFDDAESFYNGLAQVKTNEQVSFIDKKGNSIFNTAK